MALPQFEQGLLNLCKHVEALAKGCRTGVCVASDDGTKLELAYFPNLPRTFQEGIRDVPMYPSNFGSCTAAMHGNEIITTPDMNEETRWDERFVAHCLKHSIIALQSRPVFDDKGQPLGTFVMGFSEPRTVNDFDRSLMDFAADAATELFKVRRGALS